MVIEINSAREVIFLGGRSDEGSLTIKHKERRVFWFGLSTELKSGEGEGQWYAEKMSLGQMKVQLKSLQNTQIDGGRVRRGGREAEGDGGPNGAATRNWELKSAEN